MEEFITCQICGIKKQCLGMHLKYTHHMSYNDYKEKYKVDYVTIQSVRTKMKDSHKDALKGIPKTEDHKQKLRDHWAKLGVKESASKRKTEWYKTEDGLRKIKDMKENSVAHRPEVMEKHRIAMLKNWQKEDFVQNILSGNITSHSTPEFRAKFTGANNPMNDPVYKEKAIRNLLKALGRRPTKLEKSFINFFNYNNLPFRYVGNGKLLINFKNPDFVETNGKKILVEVGSKKQRDYWYGSWQQYEIDRTKFFKDNGWKCLVLWDEELRQQDELMNKINKFMEEK